MIEIREADGLSVTRSHGFDERNYHGTKVYVSGASKILLATIDQHVGWIKARRLDLQVFLKTPNSGDTSLINTEVAGTTLSTSTRLGYRWINSAVRNGRRT